MPLITKIPGVTFTDTTLPLLTRDAIVNAGTKFLFDFKSSYCFARQAAPVSGDPLVNLVDGAPGGTITGSSFTFSGGGIYIPGNNTSKIDLGNTYSVNATNNFMVSIWVKMITGYDASNFYNAILGRGQNTGVNGTQYYIDNGANGVRLRGSVGGSAISASTSALVADLTLNVVHHLALAWEGGFVKLYLDGVLQSSTAMAGPVANLTANTLIGGSYWKGYAYRAHQEDLTVSGKTAATQVAAEYALNTGRFS